MTLLEFANARENVILFWASFGTPSGDYAVFGHPDIETAVEWDDLEGEIDGDGVWNWDGEGDATDEWRNTLAKLQAYVDADKWAEIDRDYNEAV